MRTFANNLSYHRNPLSRMPFWSFIRHQIRSPKPGDPLIRPFRLLIRYRGTRSSTDRTERQDLSHFSIFFWYWHDNDDDDYTTTTTTIIPKNIICLIKNDKRQIWTRKPPILTKSKKGNFTSLTINHFSNHVIPQRSSTKPNHYGRNDLE